MQKLKCWGISHLKVGYAVVFSGFKISLVFKYISSTGN